MLKATGEKPKEQQGLGEDQPCSEEEALASTGCLSALYFHPDLGAVTQVLPPRVERLLEAMDRPCGDVTPADLSPAWVSAQTPLSSCCCVPPAQPQLQTHCATGICSKWPFISVYTLQLAVPDSPEANELINHLINELAHLPSSLPILPTQGDFYNFEFTFCFPAIIPQLSRTESIKLSLTPDLTLNFTLNINLTLNIITTLMVT